MKLRLLPTYFVTLRTDLLAHNLPEALHHLEAFAEMTAVVLAVESESQIAAVVVAVVEDNLVDGNPVAVAEDNLVAEDSLAAEGILVFAAPS